MSDTETRPDEQLARARDAFERMAWEDAFQAFSEADLTSSLAPADLETWASTSYLLGRIDVALDALARSYQAYLDAGDPEDAARTGFWIVFMLMEQGDIAQASGWLSRSNRLLEGIPPQSAAHGYMLALDAYRLVAVEGNYAEGEAAAEQVIQIGRGAGDHDIEALALNLKGRALIRAGQIEDGMPVLDEAMVSVTSGRLSPVVVGTIYCSLIEACEEIGAMRRSHEWTGALTKWCEQQEGEMPFTAQCRIHRATIFQRDGKLKEAEEEARQAYERYARTPYERATGGALYQLAEIQRLRGDLVRAEESYREASGWGFDPQPGLALLRVVQGKPERAAANMRRVVEEAEDPIERLRVLPAHVEVMLAVGDVETARKAAAELADHTSIYATDATRARLAYSEGSLSLASDDPRLALMRLREAAELWSSLNIPYEVARSRLLIGEACRRLGDDDTARLESSAARRIFEDLGVAHVTSSLVQEESAEHDLTVRELDVLGLLATGATNQEIAEELYLSVRTVDRHVGNILTKLGVRTRTAAASYAYEHDLA
ncbi:MAG: LuxR C-terminal-related transcriptional regulator [Actinomycetota bacterium]